MYIQILSKALPDLERHLGHKDFILWQDSDSGYGVRKNSKVGKWMQKNGYVTVFNAPRSPDTNWIENCFKVPKTHVRKHEIWDLEDLRELAEEGWKKLTIRMINGFVETMP